MKYTLKIKDMRKNISLSEQMANREYITSEIVNFYSRFHEINSILLVGSHQGKPVDHYSDLDFFLFFNKTVPAEELRLKFINILQKENLNNGDAWQKVFTEPSSNTQLSGDNHHIYVFDDKSYEYGISDDFEVKNTEICTTFYSILTATSQVSAVHSGHYRKIGFYYPMAIVSAIAEGTILHVKDDFLETLKKRCSYYPTSLQKLIINEELPMINYYLSRMDLAIYREDFVYFNDLMYQALDSLLHAIFSHNKCYFYSRKSIINKIKNLKNIPSEIYNAILSLASTSSKSASQMKLDKKILENTFLKTKILINNNTNKYTNISNISTSHPYPEYILSSST